MANEPQLSAAHGLIVHSHRPVQRTDGAIGTDTSALCAIATDSGTVQQSPGGTTSRDDTDQRRGLTEKGHASSVASRLFAARAGGFDRSRRCAPRCKLRRVMKEGRNYDKTVRTVFHRARAPELSLVMPECNPIGEPDERMGVGFHNVSHSSDALGHCVTFRGYGDVVKGPRISVSGRRGGRKMQLIEPDERQAFVATLQRKGLQKVNSNCWKRRRLTPWGTKTSACRAMSP